MSSDTDQTHWKCPDCFEPCRCVGAARGMAHVRCGTPGARKGEYDVPTNTEEDQ